MLRTVSKIVTLVAIFGLYSAASVAKQHKIVLIHGFQPGQLFSQPDVTGDGESYWSGYWASRADERIDWPSTERVEGKIATDYVWPKLKSMSQSGLCNSGCIFVTHSTGDLVARYIIENQETWLQNAGYAPLNIVATYDIAGAGGGSELADLAVSFAQGTEDWTFLTEMALEAFLGGDLTDNLGVLYDLKVNNARQLAPSPDARVPRLRFVGDASEYLGATSPFIQGNDDGVVGTHSACGGNRQANFGSCSRNVALNGKIENQGDAVSGFMSYHYPMLMGSDYSHGGILEDSRKGMVTAVYSGVYFNDGSAFNFNTYTQESGWWWWKSNYLYVENSSSRSLSRLIYDNLPN
jgi:hypothetical protein